MKNYKYQNLSSKSYNPIKKEQISIQISICVFWIQISNNKSQIANLKLKSQIKAWVQKLSV